MKLGQIHRHDEVPCPHCGYGLDAASGVDHDVNPTPGDYAHCISCGQWSVFTEGLSSLRTPTAREMRHLRRNPEAQAVNQAWARMKATEPQTSKKLQ